MKRRSEATGKPDKQRRHKASKPKRGLAPNEASRPPTSAADKDEQIARLTHERDEALDQQAATTDVLELISSSPENLQAVFATILENAVRICDASFGDIGQLEDGVIRLLAIHKATPPAFIEDRKRTHRVPPAPSSPAARMLTTKVPLHIHDLKCDRAYRERSAPMTVAAVELGGVRTFLGVPLLKENEVVGIMFLGRQFVRPFTDKQIELVKNFAAQAVIAIENARLLNELRQRTSDLTEALEQQTATSQVLEVIGGSPGDLRPVFETMLTNATRICEAKFGVLWLSEQERFRCVALHNAPPAFAAHYRDQPLIKPPLGTGLRRVFETRQVTQVSDMTTIKPYIERDPFVVASVELGGYRGVLNAPMLKENELIGAISIYSQEVRLFSDKQIALVTDFAAQAVIAIENARLLNELRQRTTDLTERTADLTEALEQQTATSEVLQAISSSPGDLQLVFQAMLEKAVRICDAKFGSILRWDNEAAHLVATYNAPPAFAEARRLSQNPANPKTSFGRMIATKAVVHIADASAEPGYVEEHDPAAVAAVELGGQRTALYVPMLNETELIGAFTLSRQEVRPFADKQIELVQNFAAQAVIAIENARLLNELRQRTADLSEALEQQTAASQVLQIISSSPGELLPVFKAMLENATRICEAKFGVLYRYDDNGFEPVVLSNAPPAYANFVWSRGQFFPQKGNGLDRLLRTKTVIHSVDEAAEPVPTNSARLGGARSQVMVPMLQEDKLAGAIAIYRQEVHPFTDKQIELVKNFAAQAVIAIENARLLNELRQRTDDLSQRTADLTEALEQQTATSEVLQVISRSPGDLEPVFASMLENAVRLCDAKFGIMNFPEPGGIRPAATHNVPEAFAILRDRVVNFGPKHPLTRAATTKQVVHIPDLELYADEDAVIANFRELTGARTILHVPMLKDEELVGIISIYRQQVRPFTDKQVDLVKSFAAQAVIAVENARLLKELRERTAEVEKLNQHLEQRVADQVGEIERMSRLRRFLPPQVADLIVASGSEKQLESHRREITALFCDLRGFTGFTESADAEDVMALLRDYHAAIGEIIIKYNGTLERYAGDGVMVVFNDPVPVENPALQAVLMALELREAIGALTATWSRLGHEIGFGIGIAHGFATLGTIGFEGRFDYAAIGTVSNVASRLCDEAKPGQILISPRVLMKVENAVKVEPVGEFELKGIRRPLAAYNVLSVV